MTLAMQTRLPPTISENPTIWGLAPAELHDRYWAARGVFVVRPGQRGDIPDDAELCMLVDSRTLAIFRMSEVIETMSWIKPLILFVRIVDKHDDEYREQVLTDKHGRFIRFKRFYGCGTTRCIARVAFTRNRKIAKIWQATVDPRASWRNLREQARTVRRESVKLDGKAYDRKSDDDVSRLVFDLIEHWRHPSATLPIKKLAPHVWAPRDFMIDPTVKIFGPAWIGAGRILPAGASVLGPAALWDNPTSQPTVHNLVWSDLEPTRALLLTQAIDRNKRFSVYHMTKRLFDIISALIGLLLTLPLIPLVMLAIWLEDGSPFFFLHKRETISGREFSLIKFRSMRKNAEQLRRDLARQNKADGPQFYMPGDPRITRVGRIIRRWNIDEIPQFVNVFLGHMSLVGPRPSPRSENQFCPPWREARLSVRPGITGLWQVMRTRSDGLDFQEWIRYDLQYVERANWRTDLRIIFKTFHVLMFWN